MKKPIVDHLWTKISDLDYIGSTAVNQKVDDVQRLADVIASAEGTETAKNVLSSELIKAALLRCKQCHDLKGDSRFTEEDLHIYYRFATDAMLKAEKVIDEELGYLGL